MSNNATDSKYPDVDIPIQELLDRQNTIRLLEGQTILGKIVQGHTQFQQWAVQLLQRPKNIDLIAVWEKKLKAWKTTLPLLNYPLNNNTDMRNLSKDQRIFLKWNQHISEQIEIANQLYNSVLDSGTLHLLNLNPITILEDLATLVKLFNRQNNTTLI